DGHYEVAIDNLSNDTDHTWEIDYGRSGHPAIATGTLRVSGTTATISKQVNSPWSLPTNISGTTLSWSHTRQTGETLCVILNNGIDITPYQDANSVDLAAVHLTTSGDYSYSVVYSKNSAPYFSGGGWVRIRVDGGAPPSAQANPTTLG